MKTPAVVLGASVALNLALAVWLIMRVTDAPPAAATPASGADSTPLAPGESQISPPPAAAASSGVIWTQLRAGRDAELVARLRAEGFPLPVIRTILRAVVADRMNERRNQIESLARALPWWQFPTTEGVTSPEIENARRALARDIDDSVSEILGQDAAMLTERERESVERRYGKLDAAKLARLLAIERDYGELAEQISDNAHGIVLQEERDRLQLLEIEKRKDIEALLTPAELAEFDRRGSPLASELRWQLRYFEATEAEYLALFEVRRSFDARFGRPNELTAEQKTARTAAEPELRAEIAATLGPARFRAFQIKTDPAFDRVRELVDGHNLPREAATEIVALQRDSHDRAARLRADQQLAPDERATQLTELAAQATQRATALLGARAFAEYKEAQGKWIAQLRSDGAP